jgi:hypothetical protein
MVVAPLLWHGNSCGNDFNFHLLSWLEVHAAWRTGNFYPHWAMQPNYGAGEPRFVFYPPASWMLGAALAQLLGGSVRAWSAAPGLFVFLVLTLAGYGALLLLRRTTSEGAALFAACLYLANPYTLFVVYERSAFAELMAAIWMPLLFLFTLQKRLRIVSLALVVAALWLTNAPAAVMGSYALALLVLAVALIERSWQPVLRSAASVALGLGLAAFYVLPAAHERRWVQIELAVSEGMHPAYNFLFGHTSDAYHDSILHMVSWIAVGLLTLAFLLCLVLYFALWRRRKLPSETLRFLLPIAVLVPILALLLLPVSLPVWQRLPELRYVQFPWRLLLLLSVAVAVLLGAVLRRVHARVHFPWLTAPLFVAASVAVCWPLFHQVCDFEDAVPAQVATFRADQGCAGTDEYTPLTAQPDDLPDSMPPVSLVPLAEARDPEDPPPAWPAGASVRVESWRADHRRITVYLPTAVVAEGPQAALLRLLDYPAWRVRVNGAFLQAKTPAPATFYLHSGLHSSPPALLHTDDGRIVVPLPAGRSLLTIDYAATPDVWLGRGISLLSLLVVLLLLARKRPPRRA